MPSFHNGAVGIAYLDEGQGEPIVLIHGFASSKNVNWVYPRWVSELTKNGRRAIALDLRGHGESSKPYDPAQYGIARLAGDVTALMDHLGVERADLMGYSLGARITGWLAYAQPQRLRSAIFGGLGIGLIRAAVPAKMSPKRWRRRRLTTSPIRWAAPSAPSPTRPAPIAGRSPPACAARAN